jgi:hypothetical protein
VNSQAAKQIKVSGTPVYGPLSLTAGWNLVGIKGGGDVTVAEVTAANAAIVSVWKWENNTWAVSLPGEATPGAYAEGKGFAILGTIKPGQGFWVHVGQ